MAKKIECPECEGTGEAECYHCGSLTNCEDCDGTGEIRDPNDTEPSEAQLQRMTEEHDDTAERAALRDAGRRHTL